MTSTHDIVAAARAYVGVRFAHQGRSAAGLDCLGLLIASADDCGLTFGGKPASGLDVPQYGTRPDVVLLHQKLSTYLTAIALESVCPGDVVVLKINGSPQHLALIADYPLSGELGMIHAYAPARAVVEHRYDAHWRTNTYAAFRLPQWH